MTRNNFSHPFELKHDSVDQDMMNENNILLGSLLHRFPAELEYFYLLYFSVTHWK